MRLLPYIYTAAWQAHTSGLPLMRPLAMEYPDDPNVWELGRQYLFGPDLLVAPVTRASATHWPVYLPKGDWFDFWTGERHEGGRAISVPTPLDTIPLFVRGGAIIPLGPTMQRTDERPLDDLTLLVYPGSDGSLTLYEDDGATRAHQRGAHALTEVRSSFEGDAAEIEVGAVQGEYAGQPAARDLTVRIWSQGRPSAVRAIRAGQATAVSEVAADAAESSADATDNPAASWWFDAPTWVQVRLPQVGRSEAVTVHVSW